ncbi:MAG: LEA type 2 family protein [Bacteroidetes bacterium]|jgi:LEA14-like dessication related protein|nr:LEA type 2 family protein [Bacteroidota bacterium]
MTRDKNKIAMRGAGRPVFILSMLFLSMLFCSCFKKPVFININSVKIGAVKDSILEANIDFKVYNPNGMGSTITASKINTYYKGKLVGVSTLNKEIHLPGKDTIIVPMVSKINLWTLAKVFPELLQGDDATFNITGNSKVKSIGVSWDIALKDNITINVKEVLIAQINNTFKNDSNFRIKGLKLTKIPGLNKSMFQMSIGLHNQFSFDYRLNKLNLDIYRKNESLSIANWKLKDTVNVEAGKNADIPLQVEVDNLRLLSQARMSDVFNPNPVFVLKGDAEVYIQGRTFNIPIQETRQVSFNPLSGIHF